MAELTQDQVLQINRQMTRLFPSLPYSQLRPFISKVLEVLRETTTDIYDIRLSSTRSSGSRGGYFSDKEVEHNGSIVFIELRVD